MGRPFFTTVATARALNVLTANVNATITVVRNTATTRKPDGSLVGQYTVIDGGGELSCLLAAITAARSLEEWGGTQLVTAVAHVPLDPDTITPDVREGDGVIVDDGPHLGARFYVVQYRRAPNGRVLVVALRTTADTFPSA